MRNLFGIASTLIGLAVSGVGVYQLIKGIDSATPTILFGLLVIWLSYDLFGDRKAGKVRESKSEN